MSSSSSSLAERALLPNYDEAQCKLASAVDADASDDKIKQLTAIADRAEACVYSVAGNYYI